MDAALNGPEGVGVSRGKRIAIASVAAVGSVLAASSCCLPIFPFIFAAGAAGSATFLTGLRPYLLAFSVILVAYGFFQAWRSKRCRSKPSVVSSVLLWISALFVAVSILFPQALANAAATVLSR
ncbi:MAG TPA: hypothetical protein VN893_02150 [Bryobacteraceae bacterium]|nr:hypothetical protein [Bryobacteraceae bacterium]